jgi:hypothetical protein
MTSYPPSEPGPYPESADFDKGQYTRGNPLPLVALALVVGALLGALLSRRKRKRKDAVQEAVQAAKEWLETAYEQLAEKLPQLAEKIPQTKKPTIPWCQEAFLDQAQQVGKKLKWW